jgi:acyl dehydratase
MPEFQKKGVVWEDMEVGSEVSTVQWYVTPNDIELAADLFHDDNPLYSSPSFAKGTEWGGIIAPFYFLDATFRWTTFMTRAGIRTKNFTINAHGILESFLPIRPGDQIVGKMWVNDKYLKRGKKFLTWRIELYNEEGEMVARKFWTSHWTDREILFPKKEVFR